MKRVIGLFGLFTVAAVLAASTPASAAVPATAVLKWRTSAANVAGYVDSLAASINGAVQTVDTTAWFSTADFDWQAISTANSATAQGAFRIAFTSSANTSTDSLFVAVEASSDGVTPCSNTTFIGLVGVSGEEYLSGIVTTDSDVQSTVGAGSIWLQPYLRLRVRADGNTGALFAGGKVKIHYLKRGQ